MGQARTRLLLFQVPLLAVLLGSACLPPPARQEVHTGHWHAWLDSPGGPLPFGLELWIPAAKPRAVLVNGVERIDASRIEAHPGHVLISIDHYDSFIEATVSDDGRQMHGLWEKTGGEGKKSRLPFHATAGERPRFESEGRAPVGSLAKRWRVDFDSSDDPAVGIFESDDSGIVQGTFLTTTGDYRYLEGRFDGTRLRLSCFDGAHAFLFDATLQADGTLHGEFWSRDSWHETWTARADPDATLPDAFELTRWVEGADLAQLEFPDLDGELHSLADPAFAGRARIIEIFGSWCPNCNDAIPFLVELDRRYRDRGLSVLGLAFELTGEFQRDADQVRTYAVHHDVRFPLLLAGTYDKAEASKSFPLIDRVRSFPTTIFLHGDGRVRAVHTGYAGPATGDANRALRADFEELVEELLADDESTGGQG